MSSAVFREDVSRNTGMLMERNFKRKRAKPEPVTIQGTEVEIIWTISLTGPAT